MDSDRLQQPRRVDALNQQPSGVVETLQSLIVAFVLAMTFRGFVAEGFVIPTGSMAPTLLGQHMLLKSEQTGYEFAVGLDQRQRSGDAKKIIDPMLGPRYTGSSDVRPVQRRDRMGDRILVLKGLYAFAEPKRYDVVVFKNPTDPIGESQNYIKRLIGLPNEQVWLADGDVFTKQPGDDRFHIRRKPAHVQRALWQPIHHSDYIPLHPARISQRYLGSPWEGEGWDLSGRSYRTNRADQTLLQWSDARRSLNDWTAYNMFHQGSPAEIRVSDLRVAAGIVPDNEGLHTILELEARSHIFQFVLDGSEAIVRYRPANQPGAWTDERRAPAQPFRAGRVHSVEFWHADQQLRIYLNQREIVSLEYDWSPMERVQNTTRLEGDDALRLMDHEMVPLPSLRWRFEGSPLTLHRVQVDRDLYYRGGTLDYRQQSAEPYLDGPAFGTHPDSIAELGPDHYYMLGDNSQASLDSRLWGSPHELIAEQIDPSPFVVHRKLLLGKAWVVYFPAPYSMTEGGVSVIPDFGRLRYIR